MQSFIKQPKTKGIAKVPVVMQMESLECGAACLTMILAYYGKWIPLEQVRVDCGVSRNGSNAMNILKAAKYYGMDAKGFKYEIDTLKENGKYPCIIHWNFNHFVVLDGFKNNKAYINDPAKGVVVVPMDRFDESFTGICLEFSPLENFVKEGKQKSMFAFAKKRLKGAKASLIFISITSLIVGIIGLLNPVFLRFFMDKVLVNPKSTFGMPFILMVLLFSVVLIITVILKGIYNLRIQGKFAVESNATYMWQVLRKPLVFFTQRMSGDILNRQVSNATVADTLINTMAPLLFNVFMLIFYFIVMIRYSIHLSIIGIVSILINAMIADYVTQKRINITRVMTRDTAKLYSSTISGIEMVETIKASGAENGFFEKWAGYQASVNTQEVKFLKTDEMFNMLLAFVQEVSNILVLGVGVWSAMRGETTIGMVMAFQGFMVAFMTPAMTFVQSNQVLQQMRTFMERIDDVMEYPVDDTFAEEKDVEGKTYRKLSGKIEIKNVDFGYSPLEEPLIRDFNLSIEPGKSVAIVGGSGCGKSTMSKLISGLYKPWKGEILFDGEPIKNIEKSIFASSLAVVDQDIILFEDTIANNIKMWDESIEDFEMILAARDAQIHMDIVNRPGGYNAKVLEEGKNFSGGQKQRMEIARVLAQDPTIIILDEATSALDTKTEYDVVQSIRKRGITCIVIAHRLSTIRSCDEIIVLDKGMIIDRGTHEELMKKSTLYNKLVTAE